MKHFLSCAAVAVFLCSTAIVFAQEESPKQTDIRKVAEEVSGPGAEAIIREIRPSFLSRHSAKIENPPSSVGAMVVVDKTSLGTYAKAIVFVNTDKIPVGTYLIPRISRLTLGTDDEWTERSLDISVFRTVFDIPAGGLYLPMWDGVFLSVWPIGIVRFEMIVLRGSSIESVFADVYNLRGEDPLQTPTIKSIVETQDDDGRIMLVINGRFDPDATTRVLFNYFQLDPNYIKVTATSITVVDFFASNWYMQIMPARQFPITISQNGVSKTMVVFHDTCGGPLSAQKICK